MMPKFFGIFPKSVAYAEILCDIINTHCFS